MTLTYQYRHLGRPNPVHRATEPATAPIDQEAPENAAPTQAREAFRAGWYVNAAVDDQDAEYLAACEQVDWRDYTSTLPSSEEAAPPTTDAPQLWDRIRKVEHDNNQAAARILRLEAALKQIAIVCTDNMDRGCDHRMALDFVRQIANDELGATT